MTTRAELIAEARTWLGTPFHHQGRVKGVGADCVGIIIGSANALGLANYKSMNYPHLPSMALLETTLGEQLDKISVADIRFGDVLLFAFDREPQHVGFYTDIGILHSYGVVRKCIETSLDATWRGRIRGAYRFRNLED